MPETFKGYDRWKTDDCARECLCGQEPCVCPVVDGEEPDTLYWRER